jgi:2-C-methyl-D-erythritol 4-phosphate cytidylyltransferase
MKYAAVIVAAGSGSRMGLGYNKMLFQLKSGEVILEKTIGTFLQDEACEQLVVVHSEEDYDAFAPYCKHSKIQMTVGGASRQESVSNGLKLVKSEYVLIHDGARPWLSHQNINDILIKLETCDACLLMVPVKDTIKVVQDGIVVDTPARDTLYQAQTPQAFKTSLIVEAHAIAIRDKVEATDDAMLVELCTGTKVHMVLGSYENKKVTTIDDVQ